MRPRVPTLPLLLWSATAGISTVSALPFSPEAIAPSSPELDPGSPSTFQYFENIEKPDTDERQYRMVVLENDMLALVISDPDTDMASAALDVRVGTLSDPMELPGLAHFCEHMLFMGTDKYPDEAEYSKFLADHSGYSNAFTTLENTNYHFEVDHQHLEGALDRFAEFFKSPRFDPGSTDRELHAVDSEHKKNLQSDGWRFLQLQKALSRPDHPYSKFGTGDLTTLKETPEKLGLDVREELLKFYRRYYSANVMRVVVMGRESLDDLTKLVTDKFGPVVNNNVEVPSWPESPWGKEQALRIIRAKPIRDTRYLVIAWPYPEQGEYFESQPSRYIGYLIGHEGSGSILSLLKKKGWANGLSASTGAGRFDLFEVSVALTPDGLENYEKVIEIVFRYIHLMKTNGVQEYLFNEVRDLSLMSFRFRQKFGCADYTSSLAASIQKPNPPEWILSRGVVREFRPDLIEESLGHLNSETVQVQLVSKDFPSEGMAKEEWYGTEYTVEPISTEFRDRLQRVLADGGGTETGADDGLHFPRPNAFIATNFETNKSPIDEPRKRPDLIVSTELTRLWHKKDDTFWVPKGDILFLLRSPFVYADVRTCVMTQLYTILLHDAMTDFTYDAAVAGLSYALEFDVDGLLLELWGFNEKMETLLKNILEKMKTFEVDKERFVLMKEALIRGYNNTALASPMNHATYYMSYANQEKLFTPMEKLSELQDITAEDVQRHIPNLLSHMHIESLVTGNIKREEALAHVRTVEQTLAPKSLRPSQIVQSRSLLLPKGKMYYYQMSVPDEDETNSAIEYYTPAGDFANARQRALLSLLAQVTHAPFFDQLRTKEQLGYLVGSGIRRTSTTMGLRFIIQSERDPVYLENRIEVFLRNLEGILRSLTPEEFDNNVNSVIRMKAEKPKNIASETSNYWGSIRSGYYEFDAADNSVEQLRTVTKDELLGFFLEHVHPDSTVRAKISVHVRSQREPQAHPALEGAAVDAARLLSCMNAHNSTAKIEDAERAIAAGVENLESTVRQMLLDEEGVDEQQTEAIMKAVAELLADLPGSDGDSGALSGGKEDEEQLTMPPGNVLVEDLVAFKAGCELSKAPLPVMLFENVLDSEASLLATSPSPASL